MVRVSVFVPETTLVTVLEVVIPAISVAVVNLRLIYPSPSFSHCESRVATELTYFEPAPVPPPPPLLLSVPELPPDPPVAPPPPPPPPAPSPDYVDPVEPSLTDIDVVVEKESAVDPPLPPRFNEPPPPPPPPPATMV